MTGEVLAENNLVCVGVIAGAHGIKGQVKIRSWMENGEEIASLSGLCYVDGSAVEIAINGKAGKEQLLIATIVGVADRNQSESLKGRELFVARSSLPEADDDEFYYSDLEGIEMRLVTGEILGQVLTIHNFGAGDIVEYKNALTGKNDMLPFDLQTVPEINLDEGYMLICLPEEIMANPENENKSSNKKTKKSSGKSKKK